MDTLELCINSKNRMFLTTNHERSVDGMPVLVVESVQRPEYACVYGPKDNVVDDLTAGEFVYNLVITGPGGWTKEAQYDLLGPFCFAPFES